MRLLVYNFLEFISPLLVVITFATNFKRRAETQHLRFLFVHFLSSSLLLGVAVYLAIYSIPNMVWYNAHGFFSLLFLSLFFHRIVQRKKYQKIIRALCPAGLLAYVLLLLFWDDKTLFFSAGYSISSLLIIVYSFLFLNEVFRDNCDVPSHTDNTVWVVSGLLTYYLSVYVIQITYKSFTRYFTSNGGSLSIDNGTLWGIHNVIYFLTCVFIVYNLIRGRSKSIAADANDRSNF